MSRDWVGTQGRAGSGEKRGEERGKRTREREAKGSVSVRVRTGPLEWALFVREGAAFEL